jgi:hypothetical protein
MIAFFFIIIYEYTRGIHNSQENRILGFHSQRTDQ